LFEEILAEIDFISIFRDSQSIINLAKDQMYHNRSKHIDVKFHCSADDFKGHSRDKENRYSS
jgi:predicted CoA-binding protein